MSERHETARAIRRSLGSLWNPFFARFGKLTPIQLQALPALLDRNNAILASPTASGKTEAVLAPAARHLLDEGADHPGPGLLYVAPTRALVADLETRFAHLLDGCNLTAAFRTSDSPHIPKQFPRILFTTPESWDSLLCRMPHVWKNLRTIVLDELHLLDNTYRGDQVRILMERTADHFTGNPHLVVLSATVPDAQALAQRYIGLPAALFSSGEPRQLDFHLVESIEAALQLCRDAKRYKLLVFCNSRQDCEKLAEYTVTNRLWPRQAVFVHHASLSRTQRKETEAALREARSAVCFATMTLELGVDIGDIQATLLYHPPPSTDAFVQRLGRACRRESRIFGVGITGELEEEAVFREFEIMFRNAFLRPTDYTPDLSVVVQQLFSMLFAHPAGVEIAKAAGWLAPLCDTHDLQLILDHLVFLDLVRRSRNRLFASEAVMDMGEKGQVHANIPDDQVIQVYDQQSGRIIGEIAARAGAADQLALAGRSWTVKGRKRGRLVVTPAGRSGGAGTFAARSHLGRFVRYLPPALQPQKPFRP